MFAFLRKAEVQPLPENPLSWRNDGLQRFLAALNPRKDVDRHKVRQLQKTLEAAILTECRSPFTSAKMVLQSELGKLPMQLRVFREMHEYTQIWLW